MSRYRLTPEASRDIAAIVDHIAQDSSQAAHRMGARFVRTFDLVLTSPKMGRTAEEYQLGMRRINEGVYAIFYHEIEEGIEVVRVLAGMQDLGTMFR